MEDVYFEQQKQLQESYHDQSTYNMDQTPRLTHTAISQMYGRHNERVSGPEWAVTTEELRVARNELIGADKDKISKKKFGDLRDNVKKVRDKIYADIIEAIKNKHGEDRDAKYEDLSDKTKNEIDQFGIYLWPAYIANTIGTARINGAKLAFDTKGDPVLRLTEIITGKGAAASYVEEMLAADIPIAKLENVGVFNGSVVDIGTIRTIDKIVDMSNMAPDSEGVARYAARTEGIEKPSRTGIRPFGDPVRVITSYTNSFIVGRSELHKGQLTGKFKEWYDRKEQELRNTIGMRVSQVG